MCLEMVDRKINGKICTGVGWKIFSIGGRKLFGDNYAICAERPRHKWLNEKKFRGNQGLKKIEVSPTRSYPPGWHIFATRKEAVGWNHGYSYEVRKVEYKEVLATGKQSGLDVVVARWIRIGGPAKGKK